MGIFTPAFAVLCFFLSSMAWAVSPDVVERGWKPQVYLAGQGDSELAVKRIQQMTELQRTIFYGMKFHEETQEFVDEMWDSLESFNLSHFYEMLPEQNADWRQIRVYGARKGDNYQVGPDARALGLSENGEPKQLGDFYALVQAKQIDGKLGSHYLLRNTFNVGLGELQWPAVQEAAAETFRIVVDGSPSFRESKNKGVAQTYRDKVIQMNPKLGVEDVDIIAPLWASFPAMWELLSHLGEIEDVVYHDVGQSYRQLKASFVVDPVRMEKAYPAISGHLTSMNRLFKGSLRLEDERGDLVTAELDSRRMRGTFEVFIADGRIVPIKGGKVIVDAPPIADNKPWNFTAHMQSTMTILGVVTHLQNAKARVQFLSTDTGMKVVGRMSDVPDIRVQGNALGFMPTSMIDVVLPKDLHEIIEDFIAVACEGNEGKGILLGAQFDQGAPNQSAKLTLKSSFEGLDNFFVRIGMGIVSDRIIPDPKVSEELRKLIFDTQEAFASDLKGFEKAALKESVAMN